MIQHKRMRLRDGHWKNPEITINRTTPVFPQKTIALPIRNSITRDPVQIKLPPTCKRIDSLHGAVAISTTESVLYTPPATGVDTLTYTFAGTKILTVEQSVTFSE